MRYVRPCHAPRFPRRERVCRIVRRDFRRAHNLAPVHHNLVRQLRVGFKAERLHIARRRIGSSRFHQKFPSRCTNKSSCKTHPFSFSHFFVPPFFNQAHHFAVLAFQCRLNAARISGVYGRRKSEIHRCFFYTLFGINLVRRKSASCCRLTQKCARSLRLPFRNSPFAARVAENGRLVRVTAQSMLFQFCPARLGVSFSGAPSTSS